MSSVKVSPAITIKVQKEAQEIFEREGYLFITPLEEIKSSNTQVEYTCKCGNNKKKLFKDLKRRGCRDCNNLKLKEVPMDFSVIPEEFKNEKWAPIEGGFISDKGKCINVFGKLLTTDERGRYFTNGKLQYASILMAKAFDISNTDKLEGLKSKYVVRNTGTTIPKLEDLKVVSREEIGKESGKKARQSDNFKEKLSMSIIDKMAVYDYRKVKELPDHIIFSDGNIWNNMRGQGGMRFLAFSISKKTNISKAYNKFCTGEKDYYVHRLVCMAFHPIEGKENYEDYKELQSNHKDGNTLNNHADNLEWVTKSENMKHAYANGLNKKVRGVLQYENNGGEMGEFIGEHVSVAEAFRNTGIQEHEIRNSCKKQGGYTNKKYLWKYKNEEDTEKYELKYSSKVKYSENQNSLIDDKFNIVREPEILEDEDIPMIVSK
jgi:hypothetical protein